MPGRRQVGGFGSGRPDRDPAGWPGRFSWNRISSVGGGPSNGCVGQWSGLPVRLGQVEVVWYRLFTSGWLRPGQRSRVRTAELRRFSSAVGFRFEWEPVRAGRIRWHGGLGIGGSSAPLGLVGSGGSVRGRSAGWVGGRQAGASAGRQPRRIEPVSRVKRARGSAKQARPPAGHTKRNWRPGSSGHMCQPSGQAASRAGDKPGGLVCLGSSAANGPGSQRARCGGAAGG